MFGIGSTEMLGVVVSGEIWLRVPETIQMWWDGRLPGTPQKHRTRLGWPWQTRPGRRRIA